eukprot:TRINITY_DN34663_c0_g1_i1.p1 TRINITY_DN34663_c0_g1~~TRINITY_DN34663_c0_g1_i1.p1  ORF type:complete len:778 (+),score=93.33 TRINITY_DN34663_c0_g1_i1:3-2336(+)
MLCHLMPLPLMSPLQAMASVDLGGHGSGGGNSRPSSALSAGQSRLLELGKHSRLFRDLGKHLVALGELVEREFSLIPLPQGTVRSPERSAMDETRVSSPHRYRRHNVISAPCSGPLPTNPRPTTPQLGGDFGTCELASVLGVAAAACESKQCVNTINASISNFCEVPFRGIDGVGSTHVENETIISSDAPCRSICNQFSVQINRLPPCPVSVGHFGSGRIQLPSVSAVQEAKGNFPIRKMDKFIEHAVEHAHITRGENNKTPNHSSVRHPACVELDDDEDDAEEITFMGFRSLRAPVSVENGSDEDKDIKDVIDSDHLTCSANIAAADGAKESDTQIEHISARQTFLEKRKRLRKSTTSVLIQALQAQDLFDGHGMHEYIPGVRGKVQKLLFDSRFEGALASIVVANSFVLGLQVDEAIHDREPTLGYHVMDVTFSCVFFVELLLRVYCEQLWFVDRSNPNLGWNILDSLVIITSFCEELLRTLGISQSLVNVSVLRLLRVLRVARLLRTVKLLRYFRDLRVMIKGICGSLKSLTWALVLLTMLMYLNAVLIVDTLGSSKNAKESHSIMARFGGVSTTLYTLFVSVLGGIDWADAANPLFATNVLLGFAFSLYVTFSMLCVLNIVTGVFVENANRITARSHEEVLLERLQQRRRYVGQAKDVISKCYVSDQINEDQFQKLLQDDEFQTVLRKLDVQLDAGNASSLFDMLDFDGRGCMQVDELTSRLAKLNGDAKSIDIQHLVHSSKTLHQKIDGLMSVMEQASCKTQLQTARVESFN